MTPADRRWRALATWLTNYAAELVMAYDKVADDPKSVRMAFYYDGKKVACGEIIDEMRRLSRAPRARRRKAPHADEKQSHPYDLSVGRKGFRAWKK